VHGFEAVHQDIAHLPGPRLLLDLDQGLELAQMMGVAERVRDAGQRVIGFEMIVNDDAAFEPFPPRRVSR
jgi:hypothetical protein